jgi:hypothetical protein
MRLYDSLPRRTEKDEHPPTVGSIKAREEWEAIPEIDRLPANELLASVLKSEKWLDERKAFYAKLTDQQLVDYRIKHLQK